ncbi:MAG: hypothetical protein HQK54_04825, partial [Oligoflexales bacterium]|nr:hypothetical protein [Oligoflexales bacterium]
MSKTKKEKKTLPKIKKKSSIEDAKTIRILDLLNMVINSKGPIPCKTFEDPKWGCDRTVKRHFEELNHWWELNKGGPLFEIVDSDGNPAAHGDLFIKKIGGKLELDRKVETLAIL